MVVGIHGQLRSLYQILCFTPGFPRKPFPFEEEKTVPLSNCASSYSLRIQCLISAKFISSHSDLQWHEHYQANCEGAECINVLLNLQGKLPN